MLDATIKAQLKGYLDNLVNPVEIVASLDDSAKSREMLGLLEDVLSLSEKISLRESDDLARKPMFSITRPGEAPRIHFAGIPMGHEFTSLVLALLQVGGHPPKVKPEVIEQIRNIEGEYRFETYISLSCQNCPEVVQALNLMAVINPNISHVMIDGALFQDEVGERQIMSVPTVYLNDEEYSQGRMGVEDFLRKLDTGAAKREAEQLSAKDAFDMLIVGGGPAGAAAAIYAARKGIRTGMLADRMGGQLMDTMAIENFISVSATDGPTLAGQMEAHVKDYDVDIMSGQQAEALVPGKLMEVRLASGAVLRSKSVVIATGARWREINVPGEREYRGRGVGYCPHCDGPLFKGKPIAVIGGGNSGVEAAIDLAGTASHITLLEFDSKLRADAVLQKKLFSLPNVRVLTSAQTTEIHGDGSKMTGLTYKDRNTDELHQLALDGVFIQIGLLPNTGWLKGTLELTSHGEIVVDERGQTSIPGVYAAGDVTTVPHKQIVIAMGEGSKAALSAFDYLIRSSVEDDKESAA
jgi:alkyl hydroperoxide reductase subunit F